MDATLGESLCHSLPAYKPQIVGWVVQNITWSMIGRSNIAPAFQFAHFLQRINELLRCVYRYLLPIIIIIIC